MKLAPGWQFMTNFKSGIGHQETFSKFYFCEQDHSVSGSDSSLSVEASVDEDVSEPATFVEI